MPKRRQAAITKTPGYPGTPFTKGQPSATVTKAKRNWQASADRGRDVIPRRTVNGAGRTNMWLQGGLDG